MAAAITTTDFRKATAELAKMRGSLRSWLKFRLLNDGVLAGQVVPRTPPSYAKRVITSGRDMDAEQDLADKLHALLEVLLPDVLLPNADLRSNPQGAVQLAQIALSGRAPVTAAGPSATGATHPYLWPALIVGGLLLTVTTAIKSAADVAKDAEEKACIRAGACTDYGFWLKAGGIAALAWLAWKELGVGDVVKSIIKSKRRS